MKLFTKKVYFMKVLILFTLCIIFQSPSLHSQNNHIEYGNYLVAYKYIRLYDSLFCPSECQITNLGTQNIYYFFPYRSINNDILTSDPQLETIFGSSELYKYGSDFFQNMPESDSLFVYEVNNQGPDSNLSIVTSNQIYFHPLKGDTLYILYEFTGFINVFSHNYIRNYYDYLLKANRIGASSLRLPIYQCLFLNAQVDLGFATANVAISFSSAHPSTISRLGYSKSLLQQIYMRTIFL